MRRILCEERGASLVEYALVLGLVLLVALAALTLVGVETTAMVDDPVLVNSLT
jgi:Flp pilus assembly pilin Flp